MTRRAAYFAAGWAIAFAAPHVYWATGRKEGLDTALSDSIVEGAGLGMALSCAAIALFCLCGALSALATVRPWLVHRQRLARRVLVGLVWFGAVLLVARSLDIFVEFNLTLTGVRDFPDGHRDNYLHMSRWFMFFWLPWFVAGALAWTRLAWRYTVRPAASGNDEQLAGAPAALQVTVGVGGLLHRVAPADRDS